MLSLQKGHKSVLAVLIQLSVLCVTRTLQVHDVLESRLRQRDPDSTPLHVAVRRNQSMVVKLLLEHGANPAARDHFGLTPLHLAAVVGNIEVSVDFISNSYYMTLCFKRRGFHVSLYISYFCTLLKRAKSCKQKPTRSFLKVQNIFIFSHIL